MAGDDHGSELLRLASDPLLVHDFMRREASPGMASRPFAHDPAVRFPCTTVPGAAISVSRRREFDAFVERDSPSLRAEVFAASEVDRGSLSQGCRSDLVEWVRYARLLGLLAVLMLPCVLLLALVTI